MTAEAIAPVKNLSFSKNFAAANSFSTRRRLGNAFAVLAVLGGLQLKAHAQTLVVLHSFTPAEGQSPRTALVRDSAGNLYGTAFGGGIYENCDNEVGGGTVFKIDPAGNATVLHAFDNQGDGCFPNGLLRDTAGNLFGGTFSNIFKLTPANTFRVVHNFTNFDRGIAPAGTLVMDSEGNLYGTTFSGGTFKCGLGDGCGTIYKVDKRGNETVLYSFTGKGDGGNPQAGVIRDAAGNLYGTTGFEGKLSGTCTLPQSTLHGCGTLFRLAPDGTLTVLHTFTGGTDGQNISSELTLDSTGNLYGVTAFGGNLNCQAPLGCGAVFRITPTGAKTVLHVFKTASEGAGPSGTLTLDNAGNIYGTTTSGGNSDNDGVLFKLDKNGKETVLHRFDGAGGAAPFGGVIRDSAGNLYGSTVAGGTDDEGTVFKLVP